MFIVLYKAATILQMPINKKAQQLNFNMLSFLLVPRAGIEPAWK